MNKINENNGMESNEINEIGETYAIKTSELSKHYGELKAVDKLDLKVRTGEVYGLLGPNGSGKTTTIKMLTGLINSTSGTATILGQTSPSRSILNDIGYMPQETAIYMDNTVHENILLFGEIYGLTKDQIEAREIELLDFVELTHRRDSIANTLSGGMKHRLSLACAMIHRPKLLFLDEPTVGVDPELRSLFWEYFEKMAADNITVLITTHYMDEANHCSRVGLMKEGRLIAEDEPDKLKDSTNTESLEDAFLSLARRCVE